jgi:hypothetical protein
MSSKETKNITSSTKDEEKNSRHSTDRHVSLSIHASSHNDYNQGRLINDGSS